MGAFRNTEEDRAFGDCKRKSEERRWEGWLGGRSFYCHMHSLDQYGLTPLHSYCALCDIHCVEVQGFLGDCTSLDPTQIQEEKGKLY